MTTERVLSVLGAVDLLPSTMETLLVFLALLGVTSTEQLFVG